MKQTKLLIIVGLLVLMAVSWKSMLDTAVTKEKEYNSFVNLARKQGDKGIHTDAIPCYKKAIAMRDTISLRLEFADYYKKWGNNSACLKVIENIVEDYPKSPNGYERLCLYYKEAGDYRKAYNAIGRAKKRNIQSEVLDGIYQEIYNTYELKSTNFATVSSCLGKYYIVTNKDGQFGYTYANGNTAASCIYKQATPFYDNSYAGVITKEKEIYLMNEKAEKKEIDEEKKIIDDIKAIGENKMAIKVNGKYHFADTKFKILFGEYDDAGVFENGVAPVRIGNEWFLINSNGQKVTETAYEDIKRDDGGKAFKNNVGFVKEKGLYYLVNPQGAKISETGFTDAYLFESDQPTSVKIGDKWGFLSLDGQVVKEATYSEARPFSNELAAVCIDGEWGYITLDTYKIVIEPVFEEARELNNYGYAFVKQNNIWKLLFLYRYGM